MATAGKQQNDSDISHNTKTVHNFHCIRHVGVTIESTARLQSN